MSVPGFLKFAVLIGPLLLTGCGRKNTPNPQAATAEPALGAPAQSPGTGLPSKPPDGASRPAGLKGRVIVAVQTAPGSMLEGQPPDPYRGTTILAVDPETGRSERIIEKASHPRASDDGQVLVYITAEGVAVRTADGRTRMIVQEIMTESTRIDPVLSRDGKDISYTNSTKTDEARGRRQKTLVRAVSGGEPRVLAVPDTDGVLDWSPDGKWLLTMRRTGIGLPQLYIMRPDATDERRLSDGSTFTYPRFSPDGNRIVYMHQKSDGNNALWVMDRDGRNAVRVTEYKTSWHPIAGWSPDGKRLAVVDHGYTDGEPTGYHLDVMDADGGNRRTLVPQALFISEPYWP